MSSREEAVAFWNDEIGRWVQGDKDLSPELRRWMGGYQGKGEGAVELSAFPEPYIGPLAGSVAPALVMLGLNPGAAAFDFQGEGGLFTQQIAASSYSQWAASAPYTGTAWELAMGRNKYHRDRLSFARRLHQKSDIRANDLLYVELYPFHSKRVSAAIDPDPDLLHQFVFGPIGDLDVDNVLHLVSPGGVWRRESAWAPADPSRPTGQHRAERPFPTSFLPDRI